MEAIELIRAKVERAKEHIRNVEAELSAFEATAPYEIGADLNAEGMVVFTAVRVTSPPISLSLIASDVVANLSGALDNLAWSLVKRSGATLKPNEWKSIAFPISDTYDGFEPKIKRALKGSQEEVIETVRALKPYNGGNVPLWRLYALSNANKHRMLVTSVVFNDQIRWPGATWIRSMREPSGEFKSLNEGDVLGALPPTILRPEIRENVKISINVTLREPGVIDREPIVTTLTQMCEGVEESIAALAVFLT